MIFFGSRELGAGSWERGAEIGNRWPLPPTFKSKLQNPKLKNWILKNANLKFTIFIYQSAIKFGILRLGFHLDFEVRILNLIGGGGWPGSPLPAPCSLLPVPGSRTIDTETFINEFKSCTS
jgi:hypothetical protein